MDSAVWQAGAHEVHVTHLTKPYWPETGVTKGDVLRYYLAIAPMAIPHFQGRPVTTRVYPDGVQRPSFYQRDRPAHAPDWVRGVKYRPKTARTPGQISTLTVIDNTASLIWLANAGSLEFHLWTTRLPNLERPDQAIFDLDPGDEATFSDVCRAAVRLRRELAREGIQGYAKSSGGRGMHVYVPLVAHNTFEHVRAWVNVVAERLKAANPDLIAVAHGATHRGSLVTIDAAQNGVGRNTAAPYTLRA